MARHRPVPVVRAGDVVPTMNFAFVRIEGTVVRKPYLSRAGKQVDYAGFTVDDGSGTVRVGAYGRVAVRMEQSDRLPARGDRVSVCGSLGVAADGRVRLYLRSPGHLKVLGGGEGEGEGEGGESRLRRSDEVNDKVNE
jgi:hypothetical protein